MNNQSKRKVSIIGAGNVGATIAYTLVHSGLVNEIALFDINEEKAKGEVMDIMHGMAFSKPVKVYTGGYKIVENSEIIVITAGSIVKENQSRLNLVEKNTEIFKSIISNIKDYIGNAIIVVVSNPVDIMAYVTRKLTNLPKGRVIGSGTVLDTGRFKTLVGEHLNIDPRDVNGYILGEHGDSEFANWSNTTIGGIKMEDYCNQTNVCTPDTTKNLIEDDVKYAGYEVLNRKGCTEYGIAMATTKIVESILKDENSILTVSTLLEGEYDISDVYLSIPCVVNSQGIRNTIKLNLINEEHDKLKNSANILKNILTDLKL
jgi:L-lactate dehydrogenase